MKKIEQLIILIGILLLKNTSLAYLLFLGAAYYFVSLDKWNLLGVFLVFLISVSTSLTSTIFLNIISVVMITLFTYFTKKKKGVAIRYLFFTINYILSFIYFYFLNDSFNLLYQFSAEFIIGIGCFILLNINYIHVLNKKINVHFIKMIYLVSIACIGYTQTNLTLFNETINLGVLFSVVYVIYLANEVSSLKLTILSFIGAVTLYIYKEYFNIIFLLIVYAFYVSKMKYAYLFVCFTLASFLFLNFDRNQTYIYLIIILTIVIEFFKVLVTKDANDDSIYEQIEVTKEDSKNKKINCFIHFLEGLKEEFKYDHSYYEQMDRAYTQILKKHCNICAKKDYCFLENKATLKKDFDLMLQGKSATFYLKSNCTSYQSLNQTTNLLAKELNNIKQENPTKFEVVDTFIELIKEETKNEFPINYADTETLLKRLKSIKEIEKITIKDLDKMNFSFHVKLKANNMLVKDEIKEIFSQTLNQEVEYTNHLDNIIAIHPKIGFHIQYGYGSLAEKEMALCGDNFLVKDITPTIFVACISDGMGKGKRAYEDSKKVIELFTGLAEFEKDITTCVKMLNLYYQLHKNNERYTTFDAVMINQVNYQATFYKMGASFSYIIHEDNTFIKIENKTLPLGILKNIVYKSYTLHDGDLIILTSDGIFGNILESREDYFIKQIIKMKENNAEEIAYKILNLANNEEKYTKDDMTVVVLKIIV